MVQPPGLERWELLLTQGLHGSRYPGVCGVSLGWKDNPTSGRELGNKDSSLQSLTSVPIDQPNRKLEVKKGQCSPYRLAQGMSTFPRV